MTRLSDATLERTPDDVARPRYDRRAMTPGVVHLGVGAFHRAHQAVVFDDALAAGDTRWGIVGASLRSADVRDRLAPQDGLYTLRVGANDGVSDRIVGALDRVIVAPESPAALVGALASPQTHIVTLTITEKGYLLDPASGALRREEEDLRHDLTHRQAPRTAIGFLAAGLAARRAAGASPVTVLSCDNLPHNGARTRDAVLAFARIADPELADWIGAHIAFPDSMVDRITPATTAADIAALAARLGVEDRAMVKAEPFTQWVIEDRFSGARPDFAALGVQLTRDVAPWENAKLRLLNGAHSAIAWLGALAGHDFVADAIAAPGFHAFVTTLMDEASATLSPPPELDVVAYRAALLERFANSALAHRTRQIAMDGSQKLPQRLLNTIRARLAANAPFPALALAVAGWMRWQTGRDEKGATFVVEDPLAEQTAGLLAGRTSAADRADALMTLTAVFGEDLPRDPRFRTNVTEALHTLVTRGAAQAVRAIAASEAAP